MSKRWDEAVRAASDKLCEWPDIEVKAGMYVVASSALEAFALSARGPTGPAALKDWVEGKMVLVPLAILEPFRWEYRQDLPRHSHRDPQELPYAGQDLTYGDWWALHAAVEASSPTAPDGDVK